MQGRTIVHLTAEPQPLLTMKPPDISHRKVLTLSQKVDERKPVPCSDPPIHFSAQPEPVLSLNTQTIPPKSIR